MRRYFLSLLVFLYFSVSGCGGPPPLPKPLDIDMIKLGMSKQYVSLILRAPDRIARTIILSDIFVEVWEYIDESRRSQGTEDLEGVYWLYFFNGKLGKWGPRDSDNWIGESEKIINLRYK